MVKKEKYRRSTSSSANDTCTIPGFKIIDQQFSHAYNLSRMSSECRTLFVRGRYFIETGTAQTFNSWVNCIDRITKYTPILILERITHFIRTEQRQQAILLWMKVCEKAHNAPSRIVCKLIYILINMIIGGMAIYAFIDAITH